MNDLNLNLFKIDKSLDVYTQSKQLTFYLDKLVKRKNFQKIIELLSKKTNVPNEFIEHEIKQYLSKHHDFVEGRFNKKFRMLNIFKSSCIFFLTLVLILFFSRKAKKYNCEIIFDEVSGKGERIHKLTKKFNSYKIILLTKPDNNLDYYICSRFKGYLKEYVLQNFNRFFFICSYNAIKFSFLEKINFLPIVLHILKRTLRYESIFQQIKAKFLLEERHYTNSAIKNFLFKKYGGQLTSFIQKSIIHLGKTSFYMHGDIFFTFGNKSAITIDFCGAKVKKIIPVGSLSLEHKWLSWEKMKVPEYDLINFAGKSLPSFSTHHSYLKNYYEHFNWILKFSNEFPNLKIAIKHHEGAQYVNKSWFKKELKIFKNSNVEIIVGEVSGKKNYSYGYAFTTTFVCTWASTLALELLGHNKPFYFLDPRGENKSFLHSDKYNDKWRLKSYKDFRDRAISIINLKKIEEINNKEDYCINSAEVSSKIAESLIKFS